MSTSRDSGEKNGLVITLPIPLLFLTNLLFCQIQLPSGAAVKVDASYWGMSVFVRVAEDDDEKTDGFCGNNNGDKSDDMIGSDGVTYTKDPGSIAKNAFVDTWRFAFNLRSL